MSIAIFSVCLNNLGHCRKEHPSCRAEALLYKIFEKFCIDSLGKIWYKQYILKILLTQIIRSMKLKKLMQRVLNKMLLTAIRNDEVKKAYRLIKIGADVNHETTVTEHHSESLDEPPWHWDTTHRISVSPLYHAKSEPMKRLLTGFGALTSEEARKIWAKERQKLQDKEREKALTQQERLARKQEEDTRFVDRVLKD